MAKLSRRDRERREFLKTSVTGMGAWAFGGRLPAGTLPANDTLRLGIIGAGSRGGTLMSWAHRLAPTHQVEITAVCDLWEQRRLAAVERVREWTGRRPAACRTVDELCSRSDVDAVLIATADFQHCVHAAQAVLAGKDVYVEKPFGCDFDQVRRARVLVQQSDRILQVGTQSRGCDKYYAAAKFVQSGRLGRVTYVEIAEPLFQQRWRIAGCERSLTADDIPWKEYLCYLPESLPFHPRHYTEFRLFWPYSSGPFCQWMSHRLDLVNLVLGTLPTSAVALGGVYLWKDGRTNPDTVECLFEYPGGTLVSYHMRMGNSANGRGITFYGTQGTLDLEAGVAFGNGGGGLVVTDDTGNGTPVFRVDRSKLLREKKAGGVPLDEGETLDYLGHFFDCVRTRQQPRGDLEAAFGHSVASILANQAYRRGCRMMFDRRTESMQPWPGSHEGSATATTAAGTAPPCGTPSLHASCTNKETA